METFPPVSDSSLPIDLEMTRSGQSGAVAQATGDRVDMNALTGLRGLAALHVLIFHCFIYGELKWNLQGSVSMPIFFLLSGFSLAVTYIKTSFQDCCCLKHYSSSPLDPAIRILSPGKFYQNRIARVAPVYYFTTILAIPLVFLGHGGDTPWTFPQSAVVSFLGVSTWFFFIGGAGPVNGPSWTVSTLALWWWCFPCTFRDYLLIPTKDLMKQVVWYMWLQFIVGIIVYIIFLVPFGPGPAFLLSTFHPVFRYPIFTMGCLAGIWRARLPTHQGNMNQGQVMQPIGGGGVPLPPQPPSPHPAYSSSSYAAAGAPTLGPHDLPVECCCACCECCCCPPSVERQWMSAEQTEDSAAVWRSSVDGHAAMQCLLMFICALIHVAAGIDIGGGLVLQLALPYSQLMVILGLTLDKGTSHLSKLCNTRVVQELGKWSMAIYLVHEPVIGFVTWLANGTLKEWPKCKGEYVTGGRVIDAHTFCDASCEEYEYQDCKRFMEDRWLPIWGMPIVLIVSIILGYILTIGVEEPARKWLRFK